MGSALFTGAEADIVACRVAHEAPGINKTARHAGAPVTSAAKLKHPAGTALTGIGIASVFCRYCVGAVDAGGPRQTKNAGPERSAFPCFVEWGGGGRP